MVSILVDLVSDLDLGGLRFESCIRIIINLGFGSSNGLDFRSELI